MPHEPTIDRLSAYLDDELSPEERVELESQLAESESLQSQLNKLRRVRDWFRGYPGRKPMRDVWARIATRVSELEPDERDMERGYERTEREKTRGGIFMPVFAWAGSTVAKRIGIA